MSEVSGSVSAEANYLTVALRERVCVSHQEGIRVNATKCTDHPVSRQVLARMRNAHEQVETMFLASRSPFLGKRQLAAHLDAVETFYVKSGK